MFEIRQALSSFVILCCLAVAAFAQSQATTGLIQGTVTDQNNAVIAGASVRIENTGTGFSRTVSANSDGFFSAPLLPLGTYRVTATASGFSSSILENVQLPVGQTRDLQVQMAAGGTTVTVDVSKDGQVV